MDSSIYHQLGISLYKLAVEKPVHYATYVSIFDLYIYSFACCFIDEIA